MEAGSLDERRLENYFKLKREAKYDGLSSREIETVKLDGLMKDFGGMKNARKILKKEKERKW